ncbi:TraX family protein [Pseudomonas sp. NA-150]|uniref:TraX family protein n=1 Tax=Pseudomonas sp. NA-150 TaxID=3367525 RepID=UPI0037CAE61F
MDLSNPPFLPRRDKALDLLKWLAMLSMVLDHLRYLGESINFVYAPGRLAFPWFCLAIAANLARQGASPFGLIVQWRYLTWLAVFSALAELPYRLYMPPGEVTTLNVLPTLALGLLVAQGWLQRSALNRVLALGALLLAALFQQKIMFGFWGVLLPLACLMALHRPLWWALLPGVVCLASNAWAEIFAAVGWGDPISTGALIACLSGPMLGLAIVRSKPGFAVWPMRRWAYAIYPLHFLALWGLRVLLVA